MPRIPSFLWCVNERGRCELLEHERRRKAAEWQVFALVGAKQTVAHALRLLLEFPRGIDDAQRVGEHVKQLVVEGHEQTVDVAVMRVVEKQSGRKVPVLDVDPLGVVFPLVEVVTHSRCGEVGEALGL
jgi:hypothetical protein